jgi:hypothetical protein
VLPLTAAHEVSVYAAPTVVLGLFRRRRSAGLAAGEGGAAFGGIMRLRLKNFIPAGWLRTVDYVFLLNRYVTFLLFPPLGD